MCENGFSFVLGLNCNVFTQLLFILVILVKYLELDMTLLPNLAILPGGNLWYYSSNTQKGRLNNNKVRAATCILLVLLQPHLHVSVSQQSAS